TQPSPLRTGTDALRVKLTAPNGEPLSGPEAEGLTVTAALFLPSQKCLQRRDFHFAHRLKFRPVDRPGL
ncbi:MAG: hypothetical protein M1588_00280, partial [Planctomycetes bacterium]|nr:hypothetical protein [Planctomycetota bacterium]